jgi:hypothetical protein
MISPDPQLSVSQSLGHKAEMGPAADNASRFDGDADPVAEGCHRGEVDLRHLTPWTAGRFFIRQDRTDAQKTKCGNGGLVPSGNKIMLILEAGAIKPSPDSGAKNSKNRLYSID